MLCHQFENGMKISNKRKSSAQPVPVAARQVAADPSEVARRSRDTGARPSKAHKRCATRYAANSAADLSSSSSCYVMDLAHNLPDAKVATALSDGRLELFAAQPAGLKLQDSLKAHTGPVTTLCTCPSLPQQLFSGGTEGIVVSWDLRAGSQTHR